MSDTTTPETTPVEVRPVEFRKGDKVRLSVQGRATFPEHPHVRVGEVKGGGRYGYYVQWEGNTGRTAYKPEFLELVERPAAVDPPAETADEPETIQRTGNDLVVVASDPQELVAGQLALIERMGEKMADNDRELQVAVELVEECEVAGIGAERAKTLLRRAKARGVMLSKIRQALEAGYVMLPTVPGSVVAIRVKEGRRPNNDTGTLSSYKGTAHVTEDSADILPAGEGQYVDPLPKESVYSDRVVRGEGEQRKMVEQHYARPTGWREEIGLPVEFLKPVVVRRTGEALEKRIFDQIVVSPGRRPRGDPLVIGQIRDAKDKTKWHSFLVAWFVDTATI